MAHISYHLDHHIGRITIDNPGRRNALSFDLQHQFADLIALLALSPPQVLVIRGAGSSAFASGGDLQELYNRRTTKDGQQLSSIMRPALDTLTRLPCPVIGAVNGDAAGGGVELLTACDIRVAAPTARLHFAQIRNGLTTGWGGTSRLIHLLGAGHATHLFLLGQSLTAQQGSEIGLIHQIAAADQPFEALVQTVIDKVIALPTAALARQKELLWLPYHQQAAEAHQQEYERFVALFGQPDHIEALQAFHEKRIPIFNRSQSPSGNPHE